MAQSKFVIPDDEETDDDVPVLKPKAESSGILDTIGNVLRPAQDAVQHQLEKYPKVTNALYRALTGDQSDIEEAAKADIIAKGKGSPESRDLASRYKVVGPPTGESLLPESQGSGVGSFLYNNLIRPLGSGEGMIGAASLEGYGPLAKPKIGEVVKPAQKVFPIAREVKQLGPAINPEVVEPTVKPSLIGASAEGAKKEPYPSDLTGTKPDASIINDATNELGAHVPAVEAIEPKEYKSEYPAIGNVKTITRPGKANNEAFKVNFPGVKNVQEVPNPGEARASRDVNSFRAEYGSADKTLLSREESAPIAKVITKAEDDKLKFIASTERDVATLTKGLGKDERRQLGHILDKFQNPITEAAGFDGDLINRAQALREKLNSIHDLIPEYANKGENVGFIENYLTHIEAEPDDFGAGLKQVWEYHLKKPFKDIFSSEELGQRSSGTGDILGKGIGNPSSPYVEERTGRLKNIELDVDKVLPAYIESVAKVIYDKPAIATAKSVLAKLADKTVDGTPSKLKELSQWYIKNYSRYDSAPGLSQAWSSWTSRIARTASRSMLGFNTGLQTLHVARIAANLYPELPGKYLMQGMGQLIKHPGMAYEETARLGFLPGEIRPWQFKTPTQKMDSILQLGSIADFMDKSIGYHGFKQMFLDKGLNAEQASAKAIAASKSASLTSSPARSILGFTDDSKMVGGAVNKLALQFKQVPVRIVEQYIQIAANAKNDPAAARRMLTGVGLALGGTAAGVKTFHVSPTSMLPEGLTGPAGATVYRIWSKLSKGDVEGALEDTALFVTPAGKSIQYQLKKGMSMFESE